MVLRWAVRMGLWIVAVRIMAQALYFWESHMSPGGPLEMSSTLLLVGLLGAGLFWLRYGRALSADITRALNALTDWTLGRGDPRA